MNYQQVGDILHSIRRYHRHFEASLESAQSFEDGEARRELIEDMKRHERNWQDALQDYNDVVKHSILSTWIQFVPDDDAVDFLNNLEMSPEMDVDEVRRLTIDFHNTLAELYSTLKEECRAESTRTFFQRLHEMEQRVAADSAWSGRV